MLCLAVFAVCASYAGEYSYRVQYNENDGFDAASPNCITQDGDGFIWIGTEQGLYRFDGYHFKCYDSARTVYSVFCDGNGTLWAGTDKGILLFSVEDGTAVRFDVETVWNVSVCCKTTILSRLPGGNLFIGTEGQGFFIYDFNTGELRQHCRHASLISAMATRGDSLMYIGAEESTISEFSQDGRFLRTIATIPGDSDLRLSNISSLLVDEGHLVAVLQNRGLGYISLDDAASFRKINAAWKFCIALSDGDLLMAEVNAVSKFNPEDETVSEILTGLPSSPKCLFEDRDGGLWVGIENEGLIYCPGRECGFEHILDGKNVTAVSKDSDGAIWAGTASGAIFKCRKDGKIEKTIDMGVSQIRCIMANPPKVAIGSRYDGLFVHDIRTGKTENFRYDRYNDSGIGDNCVNALFKDSSGRIYVGTEWGLSYYLLEENRFVPEPRASNHSSVKGFFEDSRKNVWILTGTDGLYRLDGKRWRAFSAGTDSGLPSNNISDITEDDDGVIWIATADGLVSYSYDTDKFLSPSDGPISEDIVLVESDLKGRIWYGQGASVTCIEGPVKKTFGKEQGLQCRSYISGCSVVADNGDIFLGGVNGIDRFSPDGILSRVRPDGANPVVITDILIDGVSMGVSDKIKIDNDVKSLQFLFSDMLFRTADDGEYLFMLKGEDKEWRRGGPDVMYGHLSPGKHTFLVMRSGDAGPAATSIRIIVKYPLYARWWAVAMDVIVAVILVLSIINFGKRKRDEAVFKEKYNFFTNIIHEIKTPLTLIKTPLEKLMTSSGLGEQAESSLASINTGAETLINLVNQLLDYRKNESGQYMLHPHDCHLGIFVSEICGRFKMIAESEGKTLEVTVPAESYVYKADHDALEKILGNLLSNAVKYAVSVIKVELEELPENFTIKVSNDGERIAVAERENVFKMFYQINGSKKGTGIGLPLARMLAQKHGGTLTIAPDKEMTTFVVNIPGERITVQKSVAAIPTEEISAPAPEKNTVLIVDDNEDLRKMIAEMLCDSYKVLQAGNGKEGIEMLEKEAVDIVLSDIVMPEMDGYEFCEYLRSDHRYSNIPVILLTAKTAVEDKIKGLKYGADDYIEKPFSLDLLMTKISSVISNRQKIKEFYRGLPVVHPSRISKITKSESDFITKMKAELEAHLSDADYNLVRFTEDMYMSQSSFYRKVKALTGLSPNDFVKEFRLQRAAEMLSGGGYLASEVYRKVGFSSVSYFSQCFKKKYGVSPVKYVDSLKKSEEA